MILCGAVPTSPISMPRSVAMFLAGVDADQSGVQCTVLYILVPNLTLLVTNK